LDFPLAAGSPRIEYVFGATLGLNNQGNAGTHKMTKMIAAIFGLGILGAGALPIPVHAQSNRIVLITPDEALRPKAPQGDLTFRAGVSRGPTITLVSPKPTDKTVQSPVHLELKFEGRGGAQVDVDSLKLTYIKSPAIDLTERVKSFAKPAGIDVPLAELPPGTHSIRAEVKDKDGRAGFINFNLNVTN
jgi:hypothetical protein